MRAGARLGTGEFGQLQEGNPRVGGFIPRFCFQSFAANMPSNCYTASMAVAAALAAVEVASALSLCSAAALAAARLLLACVWLRCWSGAAGGASKAQPSSWPPCAGAGEAPADGALVQSTAGTGRSRAHTWRSAGVPLPPPSLVMNLIKSRRWGLGWG